MAALAGPVLAEGAPTKQLDPTAMPGKPIWGGHGATVTPLAMDAAGKPSTILIRVPPNTPAHDAHATGDGQVRMLFVLSGMLYYSDGDTVDHAAETGYGPGSILAISSGTKHWVSTRDEPLQMVLVANPPAQLAPPVQMQLGK
jgi:mannose-6-phosphate isomerase-like protein (cupin superfamily)